MISRYAVFASHHEGQWRYELNVRDMEWFTYKSEETYDSAAEALQAAAAKVAAEDFVLGPYYPQPEARF